MQCQTRAHDSRQILTGETVHLVRRPGSNWRISSYDWSWATDPMLWTFQIFAPILGWDDMEFNTRDEAYAFAERQLKGGKVPAQSNARC